MLQVYARCCSARCVLASRTVHQQLLQISNILLVQLRSAALTKQFAFDDLQKQESWVNIGLTSSWLDKYTKAIFSYLQEVQHVPGRRWRTTSHHLTYHYLNEDAFFCQIPYMCTYHLLPDPLRAAGKKWCKQHEGLPAVIVLVYPQLDVHLHDLFLDIATQGL